MARTGKKISVKKMPSRTRGDDHEANDTTPRERQENFSLQTSAKSGLESPGYRLWDEEG